MNYKIFIEYENNLLTNLSKSLYDLFLENNYDATILDNNLSFSEKENIIKQSNKKNIIISNKINDNNTIEIVYSLRDNNELAIVLNNSLNSILEVSKYYQRRDGTITNLDYYKILRDINNNQSIIIFYPPNSVNNLNIASLIYQGINNYLKESNIYTVKSGDSLYAISKRFNTSIDEIKRINNLASNNLTIGQKLIIPDNIISTDNQPDTTNTYTVKSGDSLYSISKRFNTSIDEIKKTNNLTSNNLSIGQRLLIPNNNEQSSNNTTYIVKSGDSLYAISKRFNTSVDEIKKINNLTSNNLSIGQRLLIPNINEQSNNTIYTVKSGDSLYSISKRFNTTVDEIKRINNLTSNNLSINQKLIIP